MIKYDYTSIDDEPNTHGQIDIVSIMSWKRGVGFSCDLPGLMNFFMNCLRLENLDINCIKVELLDINWFD